MPVPSSASPGPGYGEVAATILVAAILSVAAVVFAARKSDVQSFVAVEDFWGGALVGFLIGYSGATAFEGLTGIASASS